MHTAGSMRPEDRLPQADQLFGIVFRPPMAIARLGAAEEPVAAYDWELDETPHGGSQTVVRPRLTLRIEPDGTLDAVLPTELSFKDEDGRIRPVAPFFELWAKIRLAGREKIETVPLTLGLLERLESGLDQLRFEVMAANRKAESRTKSAACAAIARVDLMGDDHQRTRLDAISPHNVGETPMVDPGRPLPLGHVQVVRPTREEHQPDPHDDPVDLSVVRIRFFPASGASYGPPEAGPAPSSPLAPGETAPAKSLYGRIHEVVAEENRILNSDNPFLGFSYEDGGTSKWPTPIDSYDGARVGERKGWGAIDDACDATITAELIVNGQRHTAMARVFAGPPDYAPDRRPFYSMMDELEDRDLADLKVDEETRPATEEEILDLFRRIFETTSLFNLDQHRAWALGGNAATLGIRNPDDPQWDMKSSPKLGAHSMRRADEPYADKMPDYTPGQGASMSTKSGAADRLPYTEAVASVHGPMADAPILLGLLARRAQRIRKLIRPPYARLTDLPPRPGVASSEPYRDPRTAEGQLYDMRMPPYMRHSMGVPLAITVRQYRMLMDYLDLVEAKSSGDLQKADQR